MNPDKKIITRFAPSPTGHLHIGGVRSALFNYLYARKYGGIFILRIEDTDKERSKKEFEQSILESFEWLNLSYDKLYRQSEHTDTYKKYLEQLIAENKAYISEETPKEPGDRNNVIRFRNPGTRVTFADKILGTITVDTTDLGDFVIAKDLETPVFHFANVVDDHEMGVTLVMRAQEHAPNTPRQILLWQALGWPLPEYAHIPLILAPDKTKLSKRHGAADTREYRDMGYLPEAILNFMALIGWNPGTEQELFTLPELIEAFDLDRVQKSPGVFNVEKLDWMNKEYIRKLPSTTQLELIEERIPVSIKNLPKYNEKIMEKLLPILVDRIMKFQDIETMCGAGELTYFFQQPVYESILLSFKGETKPEVTKSNLESIITFLSSISETDFTADLLKEKILAMLDPKARGQTLHPMRVALSGRLQSPDPFTIAGILGKEETLIRLKNALSILI